MVGLALGRLEREVLEELWRRGRASVSDIRRAFGGRHAYTTLMTTLDRLYKKGLLEREKAGRAFFYTPRVSREGLELSVAEDVIEGLIGAGADAAEPLLACIVDAVSERDREMLDKLFLLVQEKRRELDEE